MAATHIDTECAADCGAVEEKLRFPAPSACALGMVVLRLQTALPHDVFMLNIFNRCAFQDLKDTFTALADFFGGYTDATVKPASGPARITEAARVFRLSNPGLAVPAELLAFWALCDGVSTEKDTRLHDVPTFRQYCHDTYRVGFEIFGTEAVSTYSTHVAAIVELRRKLVEEGEEEDVEPPATETGGDNAVSESELFNPAYMLRIGTLGTLDARQQYSQLWGPSLYMVCAPESPDFGRVFAWGGRPGYNFQWRGVIAANSLTRLLQTVHRYLTQPALPIARRRVARENLIPYPSAKIPWDNLVVSIMRGAEQTAAAPYYAFETA